MTDKWIVVADASRARIFEQASFGTPLQEVADLAHPESRLHPGDLRTGGKGEVFDDHDNSTRTMRQTMPENTVKETHAERFAKEVCDHLDKARTQGAFDALVLVAEPRFLGHLRAKISRPTEKLIEASVAKNWVGESADAIQRHLADQ